MFSADAYPRTLADAVLPRSRSSLLHDGLLVVVFSAFVALCAQVEIPLWPVPLSLQTLGVFLTGAALGARRGMLALLLYLAEGAVGLPVFSGGASGIAHFAGPTGGYLVGFVVAAGVVGWLAEHGWDRWLPWTALAMAIGNLIVYALGVAWLVAYVGDLWSAVAQGMLIFVPGDLVKIAVAAGLLPGAWKLMERDRDRP